MNTLANALEPTVPVCVANQDPHFEKGEWWLAPLHKIEED
jgi:hypothetical protein